MPRRNPLQRGVLLLALAATGSLLLLFHCSGEPPLGVALHLALLGTVGLCGRRVWGVFAWLAAAAALPSATVPVSVLAAMLIVAAGLLLLHLRLLLRSDALATVLLAVLALGAGAGSGYAARDALAPSRRPWARYVAPPPSAPAPAAAARRPAPRETRAIDVEAWQLPQQRLLQVRFTNRSTQPLTLDLPLKDITHARLLAPLLRVVATDQAGRSLTHSQSFGCGMVYAARKVARVVLAPGRSISRSISVPYLHYPAGTVLPSYSHGMLMNGKQLRGAPRSPAPLRVFTVRVVYDSAAVWGSWRSDLRSSAESAEQGLRVHGSSKMLRYVDPTLRPGQAPPPLFSRDQLEFWRALGSEL